jgi:hypothetical protein
MDLEPASHVTMIAMMPRDPYEDAFRPLVERLVLQVLREHSRGSPWISHRDSPLGPEVTRRLCARGLIPARKVGAVWVIAVADLDRYIEEHQARPEPAEDRDGDLGAKLQARGAKIRG